MKVSSCPRASSRIKFLKTIITDDSVITLSYLSRVVKYSIKYSKIMTIH